MSDLGSAPQPEVKGAVSNGIPPPSFALPLAEGRPEIITANALKMLEQTPNPRHKFIFKALTKHLHQFVNETSPSTDEWLAAIDFLTRAGQKCTPLRQETMLVSDVLGVSAIIDAINNPAVEGATETSLLGPFFTDDAADVDFGESIASEGKGDYMYVEGRVLTTKGEPIPDAVIETWETDADGFYDTQYADRSHPDCRGRLRSDKSGRYGYRAVVPVAYPIPGDGPAGELLCLLGRHNMRPNHLHMSVEAPGFNRLITALYPDGCDYLTTDCVFGVKKSLVVNLKDIADDEEARRLGFPRGGSFKLLQHDIVLLTEEQSAESRTRLDEERGIFAADKEH
ncbi:aromatic compound dioxygenase [Rhizopogon salebrosus TDB-379]|nr:aromatic compound dioxygenase [Rhizopogon salebrosus TDB-379]